MTANHSTDSHFPDEPSGILNSGWTYFDKVAAAATGQTVLAYYSQRYQHSTPAEWQARIEQGQVLLNGQIVPPETTLRSGQSLSYQRKPWREPIVPLSFEVLYEDEDLWAIAKPSGLPVLPGGGFLDHTLLHQMRLRYPTETPVPVHRLGRGTSGAMLVAKSQSARIALAKQFRVRTAGSASTQASISTALEGTPSPLSKVYRALIGPTTPAELSDYFTCNHPIGKLPYPVIGHLYGHSPDNGLPSRSDCTILQRRPDATLVEVSILTGRPHQIRIHLAAAGFPMLGDPLYAPGGVPIEGSTVMPGECGYNLHSHRLQFVHPHSDLRREKVIQVVANLPEALVEK